VLRREKELRGWPRKSDSLQEAAFKRGSADRTLELKGKKISCITWHHYTESKEDGRFREKKLEDR